MNLVEIKNNQNYVKSMKIVRVITMVTLKVESPYIEMNEQLL
jgi:hypothetical protein